MGAGNAKNLIPPSQTTEIEKPASKDLTMLDLPSFNFNILKWHQAKKIHLDILSQYIISRKLQYGH